MFFTCIYLMSGIGLSFLYTLSCWRLVESY